MKQITLIQAKKVVFGANSMMQFPDELKRSEIKKMLVLVAPPVRETIAGIITEIEASDITVTIIDHIQKEPSISDVDLILSM